jgi:hypothetical protein
MNFELSKHAREEMTRRDIPLQTVESVLSSPQQVVLDSTGKRVYQSKVELEAGKTYLIRVVTNEEGDVPVVITAYRTSKIEKYWRKP